MIGGILAGRYEILQEIESDGVFQTFKGRDRQSGKDVFIRYFRQTISADSPLVAELRKQVGAQQSINHSSLERLNAVEHDGKTAFIVSEYTPGATLDSRLKRLATLTVPVVVGIGIDVCEALVALHEVGLVHGDVSARAVLSTSNEGVKLLTPGFWRAYSQDGTVALGMHKQMAHYLAPEITAGGMPTPQSDIYAVGILLWQALAGRYPFSGENPVAIGISHASSPYPSLRQVSGSIPVALDEIIKKATDKNPLKRYGSVSLLLADLKAVQDALRFGKKLTWPLVGAASEVEIEQVAPTLNAVDAEPQPTKPMNKKEKRVRDQSDGIPMWLAGLSYMMLILVIMAFAGWVFFNSQKPRTIAVPNLIGLQVEEARKELRPLGLKLRESRFQVSDKYPNGAVIETNPIAGDDIRQGAYVEATISKGSRFVEVPDFRGRALEETRALAASLNLEIADADIEYVRDRELEEGMIVSQIPEPRKKVERYTRIRLKVSNGNERVESSASNDEWHTHRVRFTIPDSVSGDVTVRIDITDDRGTQVLLERMFSPGEEVDERVRWVGKELLIRTFIDGELADQQSHRAE
jgi:eukaryotic-like serine/threonine-protein kinase